MGSAQQFKTKLINNGRVENITYVLMGYGDGFIINFERNAKAGKILPLFRTTGYNFENNINCSAHAKITFCINIYLIYLFISCR